jgi:hypothetical protein
VPTTSTKIRPEAKPARGAVEGRMAAIGRRIAEGYYDRTEVRRTVASLLLRKLARRTRRPGSPHPETA